MTTQKIGWLLQTILMVALFSVALASCGDDDDDDQLPNNEDYSEEVTENKVNNNGHAYVDLGLSVYWATCNIGAYIPASQGNKYAFGETTTKNEYTNSNYVGGNADIVKLSWGGDWRLPTGKEIEELVNRCTWKTRNFNSVQVMTATGPNGKSIDLPYNTYLSVNGIQEGYQGWYWSSTSSTSSKAYCLHFSNADGTISAGTINKYHGFLVRGVIANPNYTGSNEGSGGNSEGGSSNASLYFTNFTYTATQTSVTVKFFTNERATSATIKYGEYSATSSASATITNKQISASIKGLKKGTKYYVKCTARNSYGSVTSEDYPVMTNY